MRTPYIIVVWSELTKVFFRAHETLNTLRVQIKCDVAPILFQQYSCDHLHSLPLCNSKHFNQNVFSFVNTKKTFIDLPQSTSTIYSNAMYRMAYRKHTWLPERHRTPENLMVNLLLNEHEILNRQSIIFDYNRIAVGSSEVDFIFIICQAMQFYGTIFYYFFTGLTYCLLMQKQWQKNTMIWMVHC